MVVKQRLCDFDWTEEVQNDRSSNEKFSDEDETDYEAMPPLEYEQRKMPSLEAEQRKMPPLENEKRKMPPLQAKQRKMPPL